MAATLKPLRATAPSSPLASLSSLIYHATLGGHRVNQETPPFHFLSDLENIHRHSI